MHTRKKIPRSLALIAGALIPVALIGGYVGYSSSGWPSTPEIPEDPGTIMRAIDLIRWSAPLLSVADTQAVGGYDAIRFVQNTAGPLPASGIVCPAHKPLIRAIPRDVAAFDPTLHCIEKRANAITPILATIRDLDSSCNNQVKKGWTNVSVTEATNVEEGDTITTGSCPLTSLYFVDHSVLRLAAGTTLTLSTAGTTAGSGTTDVTLTTGELWARVLKPRIDGSYFEIGTADGAVGVRGTSVWVKKDNNGTQALAIDSGKDEVTSGAAAITVTGTGRYAIDRKEAKLGQSVSIASSNPVVVVKPDIFSAEAIYGDNTRPLIRAATLRDLVDYRSLQDGVGNLRTISMTGSWLRSRDIYSGSVVAGAIGIDITDPNKAFVDREFANTLPTTPTEKTNLCKNISGDIAESIRPPSTAVGWSVSLTYWSAAPRGTNACKPANIAWLADYRKGDSSIYNGTLSRGASFYQGTRTDNGVSITNQGQYIQYGIAPGSMQASDIKWKIVTLTLGREIPNDISKRYLLDLWLPQLKVYKQDWKYKCLWKSGPQFECESDVVASTDWKQITIQLPATLTPTQMIFGNTPAFWNQNPIWTTIQSIQIQ